MNESTLMCTLGGQPQIVTFALDWLLQHGSNIRDVYAIHLSPSDPRIAHSLDCLLTEFSGNRYNGQPCRFRAVPLRQRDNILAAIRTEAEAEIVRQTVFSLVTELKQAGRTLHLCIAGGARMMGLMALSAAQLHCGHQDKIWHIYTAPDFLERAREGAIMHDDTGQHVRLVQVPMVPWGAYLPPFLRSTHTPVDMLTAQTAWMDKEERKRCQIVWDRLNERPRDVLRGFAEGLKPQEVADRLHISLKTVSSHNTIILGECRNAWNLNNGDYLDFNFIRDKFRNFFR